MGGNDGHGDLEGRLRDARPSPPDELVTRLEADVARSAAPRTPSRLRFGLAVGFAGGFAALVAVVGGFGLLPGASETPARATVAVPADAVPAIRSLQANGVRLAAHPALVAKRSSATGTITGGKVKVIEIDTERPIDLGDKAEKPSSAIGAVPVLAPQVTSAVDVRRFPAESVYIPGGSVLMCIVVSSPPNTYYFTTLVALSSVAWVQSTFPGSYFGVCVPG